MCGITGYINLDKKPIQYTDVILNMLMVQKHRGPDDSGIRAFSLISGQSVKLGIKEPQTIEGRFEGVLGFNRLSILDLSANGHQPMASPDGKVLLTFNGEIYNAFSYSDELKEWGYRFNSTTDTEIVLALYLKYGFEGMLLRLNGMFSIVIVDLNRQEIFIARDRFGIKPIYYILNNSTFAFSSELKSFRYIKDFHFRLAEEHLDEYIVFRNILRGTLFKGIQSLDPGNYLSFTNNKGLIQKQYFDINNYNRAVKASGDFGFYGENLKQWLSKSVKSQLMSDVKLGCQLSGGIDSSLVTWLASNNIGKEKLDTVSIIFKDNKLSEEKYIDIVTEYFNISSHKFLHTAEYFFNNIEKATWHFEAPIEHPSNVALYMLSQSAKKYVTVLLSGEGSDEIFGGYKRFYDVRYPYLNRRMLVEIKKNLKHPLNIIDYFSHENRVVMATAFTTPFIAQMLHPGFSLVTATSDRRLLYNSLSGSLFDRHIKYELKSYLPDLLICQDKMSMAHSIENRVPFVDNEVVESSFTIPEQFLLIPKNPENNNSGKYLLKKIMATNFGNDFAFRKKKGFDMPLKEFFLYDRFREYLNDKIMPNIKERGMLNYKTFSGWLMDINALKRYQLDALWIVVSFEIWASLYLDGR